MAFIVLLLAMLNWEREQVGLHRVELASSLSSVAQASVDDMAYRDYFAHVSPEGHSWYTRLDDIGWGYYAAGEVLAKTPDQRMDLAVQAWMHSGTHKAIVFGPLYRTVGIGLAYDEDDGTTIISVIFSN